MDWTLQDAKKKIEILGSRGIPVMVMEPLRGGKLTDLGEENNARLKAARVDESIASWSFRWLMRIPEVVMQILLFRLSDGIGYSDASGRI